MKNYMPVSDDDLLIQIDKYRKLNKLLLNEEESKNFLQSNGISIPDGTIAESLNHVKSVARHLGYPVVLKGLPKNISHKSDHGLVKLGISEEIELEKSFKQIKKNCEALSDEYSILIEKQQKGIFEVIIGLTTDAVFGKVLMFGLGGIFVEIIKDVSFKLCPISIKDAYDMIDNLRSRKIFDGVRGKPAIDIKKIVNFLMKIGGSDGIAGKYHEIIDTVEINPAIIGYDESIVALDAVVKLLPESKKMEGRQSLAYNDIARLFDPASIGIVGISPDKPSLAKDFLELLLKNGYKGKIYPINLNHDGKEVFGWRIYDRITAVPDNIDYLYVSVPAAAVPNVLKDGKGKVHFAQIISSGFSETGPEGKQFEEAVLDVGRDSEIRLIGPNCLGMYSAAAGIVFVPGLPSEAGAASIISQSGGITTEILRTGGTRGIRFNQAISIGNSIDLGIEDFLEYMGNDTQTKIIGIYAEYVKNGQRLSALLKKICRLKPVVIFKGGRSALGAKAASSHTGAMASNYTLWEAMCRQHGAILVRTLNEFLNVLLAFQGLTPTADNSLLLVSHSGGLTVTGADLCEEYALAVPELDDDVQQEIFSLGIPPGASIKNPVDLPLGTLAARTRAGEKLGILRDFFGLVGRRKHFSYDMLYLMTDNVIVAANGVNMVKDLFDLVIELGGFNGTRKKRFVLAINYNIQPEVVMRECSRAANAGVPIFRDLADALQSISRVVQYGAQFKS